MSDLRNGDLKLHHCISSTIQFLGESRFPKYLSLQKYYMIIGNPWETDMPHRRRHNVDCPVIETNFPHQRPIEE